jgi:hypothetical protein
MFIDNKYTKWYYNIVKNAKSRVILDCYTEKHHIVPRCMGGKDGDNIVTLTAKEHFMCHRLLIKMVTGQTKCRLSYALLWFTRKNPNHKRPTITSRQYETIRKEVAKASSILHKGKIVSEEAIKKQKITKAKNKYRHSEEAKQLISNNSKMLWENKRDMMLTAHSTPEVREKISKGNKGKIRTKEVCADISKRTIGDKNPMAKLIKVISPDGREFVCNGNFKWFCIENGLPFSTMCHILHKTRQFSSGKTVGWRVEYTF